ncbi:sporulation transcriptional regulator SpoIIID [Nocardia transvalensis]|uniref:sporulation transcriptional regulator SpoIIID n=1 Tax=Nocardia transvalensis TaxID=37333 RepID=UPI0018949061|nr:sporulation transcriptional regulator SpoIIID [Nocardia transvalensis]MBF6332388.1 sporulation transcriptional regulator SpoIIID [Nocardia transvalensis]
MAGATIRAIADKLGVSKTTAHRDVAEALAEIKREPAQAVLDMELHRLDAMLLGLYPTAVRGDVKAVLAALKIMDRRAKYLGLDNTSPADTGHEARHALDSLHAAIVSAAEQITDTPTQQ